jgi:hypothetical protein
MGRDMRTLGRRLTELETAAGSHAVFLHLAEDIDGPACYLLNGAVLTRDEWEARRRTAGKGATVVHVVADPSVG